MGAIVPLFNALRSVMTHICCSMQQVILFVGEMLSSEKHLKSLVWPNAFKVVFGISMKLCY